jgi:single-strand DNA-binding protein
MSNLNLNKVVLAGRLTAEPELKQTPSGVSVVRVNLAINRRRRGADQNDQQQTDFITVVAWRQTAEFISRYFHKGSCISIVGQLQQNSWTDQQGAKRTSYEVLVDEVAFVDSASENRGGQGGGFNPYAGDQGGFASPAEDVSHFEQVENEDDLPF